MPFVFFYKNYNHGDINILKNSLSQCLTQYYPFAGRFSNPSAGYIDCNDEGVEFVEASHDSRLDEFIHETEINYDKLGELVPNVSLRSRYNLLEVQLNHFAGGGVAVTVSTSHKVADGLTMFTFVKQWAAVTRGGTPIKPMFPTSSTNYNHDMAPPTVTDQVKHVTRVFRFPNSKINELKKKVISTGLDSTTGRPLTRVEVLSSLLVKCAVDACTAKEGTFKPSVMLHSVNMRNKLFKTNPETAAGNILTLVDKKMDHAHEIMLHELVSKLRSGKTEIKERNVHECGEKYANIFSKLGGAPAYFTSSLCGFPLYETDFGWGNPVEVSFFFPDNDIKTVVFLDSPDRGGIKAMVHLPQEEMMILQQDKEFIQYLDA